MAKRRAGKQGGMAAAHTPRANAARNASLARLRALGWVPGKGWPGGVDPRKAGPDDALKPQRKPNGNGAPADKPKVFVDWDARKAEADATSLPSLLQATADALANIARAFLADELPRDVLAMAVATYDAVRERDARNRANAEG